MNTEPQPQAFASVWDALEDDPECAHNLKMRSHLMMAIRDRIGHQNLTQAQAAALMHTTQPRISALLNGRIADFSLDTLVQMAHRAGLRVELQIPELETA